jgi:hypothetical protein
MGFRLGKDGLAAVCLAKYNVVLVQVAAEVYPGAKLVVLITIAVVVSVAVDRHGFV